MEEKSDEQLSYPPDPDSGLWIGITQNLQHVWTIRVHERAVPADRRLQAVSDTGQQQDNLEEF